MFVSLKYFCVSFQEGVPQLFCFSSGDLLPEASVAADLYLDQEVGPLTVLSRTRPLQRLSGPGGSWRHHVSPGDIMSQL